MFKSKQITIIFILGLSITQPLAGMWFTKKMAKTMVSKACTTLNWATVAIPIAQALYSYYETQQVIKHKKYEKYIKLNAPPEIVQVIQQEAKKRNLSNVGCRITDDEKASDYSIIDPIRIVNIPKPYAEEFSTLIKTQNKTPEQQMRYNWHIATIHHELTHEKRQTSTRKNNAKIAIAITAQVSSLIVKKIVTKKIPFIKY